MIDLGEIALYHFLHSVKLLEGNVGLIELAYIHLSGHNILNESGECLRRVVLQGPGSRLDAVADHEDDLFLGLGLSSFVEEAADIRRVTPFIQILIVEVPCVGRSMMGTDEFRYGIGNLVLLGKFNTVRNMVTISLKNL